jgi:hypothetical protein
VADWAFFGWDIDHLTHVMHLLLEHDP